MNNKLRMFGNEFRVKYLPIETAMLILDFVDADWEDFAWLVENGTLRHAIDGIKQIGVGNIQLRCKDWSLARSVIESFGETETLKITCFVPLADLSLSVKLNTSRQVSLALRLPNTGLIKHEIREHVERLRSLQKGLNDQIRFVAVVVSVDLDSLEYSGKVATEFYNATGLSVILDPKVDPLNRNDNPAELSWQELDTLYRQMIDLLRSTNRREAFLMDLGVLPTRLLTEHPCNCYVCWGETCHSQKSNLPRRLVLLTDGTVLPESRSINKSMAIGNIKDGGTITELLIDYANGKQHELFLNLAKKIFVDWVQPCPFRVVPWTRLLVELSYEI